MKITEAIQKVNRPERVIQFGEGGFLRGFTDWMIQKLNDSGIWEGNVVVVQPIEQGMCDKLSSQDCLYTHVMRGLKNGEPTVEMQKCNSISRCVKPYEDFEAYKALAKNPDFRFIVSNTTEAGIAYEAGDKLTDAPPKSFPAKLTVLLYERFQAGLNGFVIIPCELSDKNGETLRAIVLRYAEEWNLGADFKAWIENENKFYSTLVDRIVTGYPRDEKIDLGYEDDMVNTSELFHLWVIEGDTSLKEELPFDKVGLDVIWTEDQLYKYKTRKVRILNGAHTSLVPYAMLRGFDTVKSCMEDEEMFNYLKTCIFEEIIPTLDLPEEELKEYAQSVLERFSNPFINHFLSSIALNSVSKFKVRVLPSLLTYIERYQKMPQTLLKAFGALLKFYRTDMANDDKEIMAFLKTATVEEALANESLWDQDLSFLAEEVKPYAI